MNPEKSVDAVNQFDSWLDEMAVRDPIVEANIYWLNEMVIVPGDIPKAKWLVDTIIDLSMN